MEATGRTHTKHCIECSDELVVEQNWWESFKGKKHYKCMDCYAVRRRENYLKRKARELGTNVLKQYNQVRQGYVYALTNPSWPEWIKVGMAIDADDRCRSYQTGSPFRDYQVEFSVFCEDRAKAEREVHKALEDVAKERRGEWFKIQPSLIQTTINNLYGNVSSE